jgi:hypothetical protein
MVLTAQQGVVESGDGVVVVATGRARLAASQPRFQLTNKSFITTVTRSSKYNFDFSYLRKYLLKSYTCILLWKVFSKQIFVFRITQYIGDARNARTLTQTLPLEASSKTVPANPQDWRSHHRRLAVGGNVAYHWKHKRR